MKRLVASAPILLNQFVAEKEILCKAGSSIVVYPEYVKHIRTRQWIVCVDDWPNPETIFEEMFGVLN